MTAQAHAVSIVIPAFNEEAVVGRLLDGILRDAGRTEFLVIVVCNGCTDNTAAVAAQRGALVVEVPEPSKVAALDAGDRCAGGVFPRLYLDADIVLSADDVRKVARILTDDIPLVAAPRLEVETAKPTGRPNVASTAPGCSSPGSGRV